VAMRREHIRAIGGPSPVPFGHVQCQTQGQSL
jgi:hypothetical protein